MFLITPRNVLPMEMEMTPEQQKCPVRGVNTIKQEPVETDPAKTPEHVIEHIVVKAETLVETDPIKTPEHEIEHIVVKAETLEWETPDDHRDTRDPLTIENEVLTIENEESLPSEDSLASSKLNKKMEDEEDEESMLGEEEHKNEVESVSCGNSSESLFITGVEEDNSTDQPGSLVTRVRLAAGTGKSPQYNTKKQASCGYESGARNLIHRCDICKKIFTTQDYLRKHLLQHTRPFRCDFCSRTFTDSGHLKQHFHLHTVEHLHRCDICSKIFSSSASLKRHVCIGECPYSCGVCRERFRSSNILKEHTLTHIDKRPYVCGVCGKSFKYKSIVIAHLRVHTDERPFTCGVCNKKFTQLGNLKTHFLRHINK